MNGLAAYLISIKTKKKKTNKLPPRKIYFYKIQKTIEYLNLSWVNKITVQTPFQRNKKRVVLTNFKNAIN